MNKMKQYISLTIASLVLLTVSLCPMPSKAAIVGLTYDTITTIVKQPTLTFGQVTITGTSNRVTGVLSVEGGFYSSSGGSPTLVLGNNLAGFDGTQWYGNGGGLTNINGATGGGGASLSNTIPLTLTTDSTNIWLNAGAASFWDVTLTNNVILNLTNVASPAFANGEPRTIRFKRSNGAWNVYTTNANLRFGQDITSINIGPSTNSAAWVQFRWYAPSNSWECIGNASGF